MVQIKYNSQTLIYVNKNGVAIYRPLRRVLYGSNALGMSVK